MLRILDDCSAKKQGSNLESGKGRSTMDGREGKAVGMRMGVEVLNTERSMQTPVGGKSGTSLLECAHACTEENNIRLSGISRMFPYV